MWTEGKIRTADIAQEPGVSTATVGLQSMLRSSLRNASYSARWLSIDDDFMRCPFKDNIPLAELVLRIITGKQDLVITDCRTQKDIKRLAGEFYSPACVVRMLVEVLQPYNGRVYDSRCGSGGMFVRPARSIENHGGNINKISVFGQDSNPATWKMAQMNLAIRGIEAMPTQPFYTAQIPVSLWFLAKNKKQKGKTLFIDARKLGTMAHAEAAGADR